MERSIWSGKVPATIASASSTAATTRPAAGALPHGSAQPPPGTAGNHRSPATATARYTWHGTSTANRPGTTCTWPARPGATGTLPGRWLGLAGSRPTSLWRPTARIASGWPGTSPASTGARTGAIRSISRPTRPGCTTPATFAWRSTTAGSCARRRPASSPRCQIRGPETTSTSTRSWRWTAPTASGHSSGIAAPCSTTSTGARRRTTRCGRSTPATTTATSGPR